jgi:AcrR family transcriptional regulator
MSRTVDTGTNPPSKARTRLVDAAAELFYAEGIRSVPVERVLDRASVTRSTLYRHFGTKEDLVLAYLRAEDATIRARFEQAVAAADGVGGLLQLLLDTITHDISRSGFRGCPFMNAAMEFPEPDHPVRRVVDEHRSWFAAAVEQVLRRAGHSKPARAGRTLVILRDGSMMGGYLDGAGGIAESLVWAAKAVVGELA